jgi:hypothetical protein
VFLDLDGLNQSRDQDNQSRLRYFGLFLVFLLVFYARYFFKLRNKKQELAELDMSGNGLRK